MTKWPNVGDHQVRPCEGKLAWNWACRIWGTASGPLTKRGLYQRRFSNTSGFATHCGAASAATSLSFDMSVRGNHRIYRGQLAQTPLPIGFPVRATLRHVIDSRERPTRPMLSCPQANGGTKGQVNMSRVVVIFLQSKGIW